MDALPPLPLSLKELPAAIQRFADPAAAGAAKLMAARGVVPVKGADLVCLLVQLTADSDENVAKTARDTLTGMPREALLDSCRLELHTSIIDKLGDLFHGMDDVLEVLMLNGITASQTVIRVGRYASEAITEVVATNQQRLLACPEIIEALYKNPKTRMSTVDRLVELAARNNVELTGIPTYQAHVEAIRGELIPEPTAEPSPDDALFSEALSADSSRADVIEETEEGESVSDEFKPLSFRISRMKLSQKLRLAMVGNAAARALLMRDRNKQVAMAAVSSGGMTDVEAVAVARTKEISEEILRYIANKREWTKNYELKRALVFNPKVPTGISLRFLNHMMPNDLKDLARSKNIAGALRSAALQRMAKKGPNQ